MIKLSSYWKREEIDLEEIGNKIYCVCQSLYESFGFNQFSMLFKKHWNFNISEITHNDFLDIFIERSLDENKSFLKNKGLPLNKNVKVPSGFTMALRLKMGHHTSISILCCLGVYSPHLVNSINVLFYKFDYDYNIFFKTIVDIANPQYAVLTDDNLNKDVIESNEELVPGYIIYLRDINMKLLSELPKEMLKPSEKGVVIKLAEIIEYSEAAVRKAILISSLFKKVGVNFNSIII